MSASASTSAAAPGDARAGCEVVLVGEAGGVARAALDQHLGAAVADSGDDGGDERHPALTSDRLCWNADDHLSVTSGCRDAGKHTGATA